MMKRNVCFNFFQLISIWMSVLFYESSACKPTNGKIANTFNYHDFDDWGKKFPLCKNGEHQSPINLGPGVKLCKTDKSPVSISNYDQKLSNGEVKNNGYSVQLNGCWDKDLPTLTGKEVNGEKFEYYTIALHWGAGDDNSTEHSFNGTKYAAELHIVHKNAKYSDLKEAIAKKDGVVITALLFELNDSKSPNKAIQQIAKFASKVKEVGSTEKVDFDLASFDFKSMTSYYSYIGSLTIPPCSENIRWFVPVTTFPIDRESLNLLRSVKLNNNDKHNIRPIQKCNDRDVKLYVKAK